MTSKILLTEINKTESTSPVLIQLIDFLEYASEDNHLLTNESSLLEGILFIETHGLHNIRYFSPYNNHKPISDQSCSHTFTSSEDKNILNLTTILCRLFPSDLGTISIENGTDNNLYSFLSFVKHNSNQRNDLKILAALLFCTCDGKNNSSEIVLNNSEFLFQIKSNCDTKSIYNINVKFGDPTIVDKFKSIIEILDTLLNIDVKNDILTPCLIIKSFIAFYLSASDLGQLYSHYKEILDFFGIKSNVDRRTIIPHLERDLRAICSQFQFPYEKSPDLPYALVPIDKQIQKQLTEPLGYWNCVENSLYHFLNCILWDGDNNRYIKINSEKPCVIDKIFSGKIRGTPDKDTLELWHKLVEDLPTGKYCNQRLDHRKLTFSYDEAVERIFYVQKINLLENKDKTTYNFEVETGFINFIKILEVLTNKQGILIDALKPALIKNKYAKTIDIDLTSLDKCFHQIIKILVGSKHSQYFKVQFKKTYYSCEYTRKDVFGQLWIQREYPGKCAKVEFMLDQDPGHAFVAVSMIDAPTVCFESFNEEIYIKEEKPFLGYLIKSYINSFNKNQINNSNSSLSSKNKSIHEMIIGFRLDANKKTNMLLSNLINQYIINRSSLDQIDLVSKQKVQSFCLNVLNRLPTYDPETLKLFVYPIYAMRNFLEIDPIILDELEEIYDSSEYDFSYKIHNDSILFKTIEKVDAFLEKEFDKADKQGLDAHQITYSQKKCSGIKVHLEKSANLIIERFESNFKSPYVCLFELKDNLDNILSFLSIYGSFFLFDESSSTKKLSILDYHILMNMFFSKNVNRETIIEYVGCFIRNFKNEKFQKVLAITEIIDSFEKKNYLKCIQIIKSNLLDYELGIKLILSCKSKNNEIEFKTLLLEACDDNEKKDYLESLIKKHEEMVLNEMSKDFDDFISIF
ncbi:unnamed protein product [Brachionus calyciflorus]|uniref:Uncharacterized protein n=1 Tax=Brachionus calyciflorus TaxID=104777 RepID=A0A813MCR0_9BILA|nr:unnamed protein product [Brachionus calyciflorus]